MNRFLSMRTCRPGVWTASLALIGLLAIGRGAAASDCLTPRYDVPPLPVSVLNPSKAWNGTDTGIVVDRYVGLAGVNGLRHGVDLSANNRVNYDTIIKCGGTFAFLRLDTASGLDAMYDKHRQALAMGGMATFPYAYFAIPKDLRLSRNYLGITSASTQDIASYMAKFSAIGTAAADAFAHRIAASGIPEAAFSGMPGQILAIDVEEKLTDEPNSTPLARTYYGRFYAKALCSWLDRAREKFPKLHPILYTTPSIFGDYLNYALPPEQECLHGLPIWLARTTPDGGDVIRNSKQAIDQYAQRLCLVSGGNRCIVHQYSHRGVLWGNNAQNPTQFPHVDLDRIFLVKIVPDGANAQSVRE
jgi:hypothetical protein